MHLTIPILVGKWQKHKNSSSKRLVSNLQDHVPPDDERDKLADGDVAIDVGRPSGVRDADAKFGVAEA